MPVTIQSPAQYYHFRPGAVHKHEKKRIIVCCDGTWMDSDASTQTPSNVTRIMRAIPPIGHDHSVNPPQGITQVTYYQNGIGTGSDSLWTKYVGGTTGDGMALNIREAYSFICLNYNPGDEIFLIGFSRGAFTARSVSTLINAVGLLTPHGLRYSTQIFEDWEFQDKEGWKSAYKEPWPDRPKVRTEQYRRKLLELELTRPNIPIKCVAVWDTVGALGIPTVSLMPAPPSTDFGFTDTKVEANIEYAFHALALDEHRRSYQPTIWEKPTGQEWPRVLKQTWFPGVHSDVGGSYDDDDLADVTLAWMVGQLDAYRLISFNHDYIIRQARLSIDKALHSKQKVRDWGLGKIHDSMTLFFRLGGSKYRTPCEYYAFDSKTQKPTNRPLENTCEAVHASVRIRMGKNGLGYNDKKKYDCESLIGWEMLGTETQPDTPIAQSLPGESGAMKEVKWRKEITTNSTTSAAASSNSGKEADKPRWLEMPEDKFTHFERLVLRLWPDLEREFDAIKPGQHQMVIKRGRTFPTELRTVRDGDHSGSSDENSDDDENNDKKDKNVDDRHVEASIDHDETNNSSNSNNNSGRRRSSGLKLITSAQEQEHHGAHPPVRQGTI